REFETAQYRLPRCVPAALVEQFTSDRGNDACDGRTRGGWQDTAHRREQSGCRQIETGTEGADAREDCLQPGDVSLAIACRRESRVALLRIAKHCSRWLFTIRARRFS